MSAGIVMKKINNAQAQEPVSFLNIPDTYKSKEAKRRGSDDPTLMVMSVLAGVGIGFVGLVITGQF